MSGLQKSQISDLKKSQSQLISPFLLRFSGKLNQLTKQGTVTHSQIKEERKSKTAVLGKNGQNSLLSLAQIRSRNQQQFQSNFLHSSACSVSSVLSAQQPLYCKANSSEFSYSNQFLKSVYLHGRNISSDFEEMLTLLNRVEKAKNLR